MDDVVSSFPLLHLPSPAIRHVLRHMEFIEIVGFSLCSKITQLHVKSLNLICNCIEILFNNIMEITVRFKEGKQLSICWFQNADDNQNWTNDDPLLEIPSSNLVEAHFTNPNDQTDYLGSFSFELAGFGVKKWIMHLMKIFNCDKINACIFTEESTRYNLNSIHDNLKGFEITGIFIGENCPALFSQKVVKRFLHVQCFELEENPFQGSDSENPYTLWMQNCKVLRLINSRNVKLNDLLAINSTTTLLVHSELSEEDLNRFIKHWINGSNKRTKHFNILFDRTDIKEEVVFKGVNHHVVPIEKRRVIERIVDFGEHPIDIQRFDGTEATIRIFYSTFCICVELFVWN